MFTRNHYRFKNVILIPTLKCLKSEQAAQIHICNLSRIKTPPCNRNLLKQQRNVLGSMFTLRYASTDTPPPVVPAEPTIASQIGLPADAIPEPPVLPTELSDVAVQAISGEPSFASLGLGGWSPVGIVQNCFEFLHITCDLPWWGAIIIGTITVRVILFPLVIMAQRNGAKLNNNLPQLQAIQLKMTEARQRDDKMDAARYGQEMMRFMRDKEVNPLKNMLVPLAQAPLFISFFMGLRGMTSVPVDSMRTGGLFWFTDLTLPDQYYLLPLITCTTLWITIEVGTDSARLSGSNMQLMKYFLRALPLIVFPLTINFPEAILLYWASSNFISLTQVAFLRIPAVRDYFKIERLVKHNPQTLPIKDKGFVKGVKESWTNMKISNELEERQRADQIQFMQAGRGAVKKTYKYDPTQPRPASAISAKKKDV